MSTRAIYSFEDENYNDLHVYKHHDGYPSGACTAIKNALDHSWPLPRFEADEFGASFCAGNKPSAATMAKQSEGRFTVAEAKNYIGGGIRLLQSGEWQKVAPGDIQYRYLVKKVGGELQITAFGVSCNFESDEWTVEQIFEGTLADFEKFAEECNL